MKGRLKVFATTSGQKLAQEICAKLSIDPGRATVSTFNDGEARVQIDEDVRGADVYIVGALSPPAENWVQMALLSSAARDSSAGVITLVPSYLGYNRQDRKDKPRVPISAQVMINFLAGQGADRALLVDIHSEPTAAFFKPLVVDHLYGSHVGVPYLRSLLSDRPFVVAAPDKGGGARAQKYAEFLNRNEDLAFFHKSRSEAGKVSEDSVRIIGDVSGKDVVFIDDMIDTGGTLIADANAARKAGAKRLYAFATHALFSGDAVKRFDESPFDEVIVTDSVPHEEKKLRAATRVKLTVLPLSGLLAHGIRRLHDGQSLSQLINPR